MMAPSETAQHRTPTASKRPALFKRPPLVTQSIKGEYFIPAESGNKPIPAAQVIIRLQNYMATLVDDLNDYAVAQSTVTRTICRCCYSGGIFNPQSRETIQLRLAGGWAYLSADSIEDAYHDEEFPPPPQTPPRTLPGGHVIADETPESFLRVLRVEWLINHRHCRLESREVIQRTPLGRVVLEMGWKPATTLSDQAEEWRDAYPKHLFVTS